MTNRDLRRLAKYSGGGGAARTTSAFVSWLPMILILAALIFFVPSVFKWVKGLFGGISDAGKSLLETLGLSDSKGDVKVKDAEEAALSSKSPWNPQYYHDVQQRSPVVLITVANCQKFYNELVKNFNINVNKIPATPPILVDNPEGVLAWFKLHFQYKTQVSFFCEWFAKNKKSDFLSWLHGTNMPFDDRLSNEELSPIITFVDNLPVTRK